jgi:hypothetical protein
MRRALLLIPVLLLALLLVPGPAHARPQAATVVTISGTVSGPGGPVAGVWVAVNSHVDWQETTTDASGIYSVTIEAEHELIFHVRPGDGSGLAQTNLWRGDVSATMTQDFALVPGHVLQLRVTGGDGQTITEQLSLAVMPLVEVPAHYIWYDLA